MTKKATIKQAELMRMAKVAKEFGVVVWQEIDGVKYCVGPSVVMDNTSRLPRGPAIVQEWQEERDANRRWDARKKKLPDDFRL